MAIVIRGAPAPGWYFPLPKPGETKLVPYLWTGIAGYRGNTLLAFRIGVFHYEAGPQLRPEWNLSTMIKCLANKKKYELVAVPPASWRGQDIRDAVKKAEELASQTEATPEQ